MEGIRSVSIADDYYRVPSQALEQSHIYFEKKGKEKYLTIRRSVGTDKWKPYAVLHKDENSRCPQCGKKGFAFCTYYDNKLEEIFHYLVNHRNVRIKLLFLEIEKVY